MWICLFTHLYVKEEEIENDRGKKPGYKNHSIKTIQIDAVDLYEILGTLTFKFIALSSFVKLIGKSKHTKERSVI